MTLEKMPPSSTMSQNTFEWNNRQKQYLATLTVNLISLAHGLMLGWVSPAMPKLVSKENPPLASGPLTNEQISWVGSLNCIAAIIGAATFGYFTPLFGSKRSLIVLTFPLVAFWLLIYFGQTYYHVLIARFIGGWTASGVQGGTILFVSEIANDDIRGRLGAVASFTRNIGLLIAYILGANLAYRDIPVVCVIFPIFFAVVFMMMPNTPRFYLQRGQIHKAEKALKYYKGYEGKSSEEDMAILKEFEKLKAIVSEQKLEPKLRLADFNNRAALKGLLISTLLTSLSQVTAITCLIVYAVKTFQLFGTFKNPYTPSIILATTLIVGSLTSSYLADKIGRKKLNLISLLLTAAGLLVTALFYYLNLDGHSFSSYSWIPVFSLSFAIYASSAGISALGLICSVENLPAKIRTSGMAIVCSILSLTTFICLKTYLALLELFDLHGCLTIYAVGCILGFVFVLFVLDETSGKSLDEVGSEDKIKKV